MVTILLVEDDAAVRLLMRAKRKDTYHMLEAGDGLEAQKVLDTRAVDLMIVDIMMPNMNGYEFVRTLRESGDETPVIMLSALGTFEHKKNGYALGIDEYLTKPVDYEELRWHIEAILRRAGIESRQEIRVGSLVLKESTMQAQVNGIPVELTETEFQLLYLLLSYPDQLFTKQQLMDRIWGYDTESDYSTIKTYISRIRRKFEDCRDFEILSVRGLGYNAACPLTPGYQNRAHAHGRGRRSPVPLALEIMTSPPRLSFLSNDVNN